MLQGLGQRKVRLRQLFGSSSRCPFEDVITSTVFGPLDFLPAQDAWMVVRALARKIGVPDDFLTNEVDHVSIRFWWRLPSAYRERSIEPDLVIDALGNGTLVFRLIVEVKWGAALETDQLVAAWDAFPLQERLRSYQLLLVLNPGSYERWVEDELKGRDENDTRKDGWDQRLKICSWRELSDAVRALTAAPVSPGVQRWADLTVGLLQHEDVSAQIGWERTGLKAVRPLTWAFTSTIPAVTESAA